MPSKLGETEAIGDFLNSNPLYRLRYETLRTNWPAGCILVLMIFSAKLVSVPACPLAMKPLTISVPVALRGSR